MLGKNLDCCVDSALELITDRAEAHPCFPIGVSNCICPGVLWQLSMHRHMGVDFQHRHVFGSCLIFSPQSLTQGIATIRRGQVFRLVVALHLAGMPERSRVVFLGYTEESTPDILQTLGIIHRDILYRRFCRFKDPVTSESGPSRKVLPTPKSDPPPTC